MLDEDIIQDFEGAVVKYLFLAIASNPEQEVSSLVDVLYCKDEDNSNIIHVILFAGGCDTCWGFVYRFKYIRDMLTDFHGDKYFEIVQEGDELSIMDFFRFRNRVTENCLSA